MVEVVHKDLPHVPARIHQDTFDLVARADLFELRIERPHGLQVSVSQVIRSGEEFVRHFQPDEFDHPFELEVEFVMVHELEQHDFVPIVIHPLQDHFQGVQIGKEVTEHHHDLPPAHSTAQFGQALRHACLLDGIDFVKMTGHPHDLRHRVAGRQHSQHFFVERGDRDFVTLADDGVAQHGGHLSSVEQFLLSLFAVPHGRAHVQNHVADEIGLHFVLLDEVLIAREVETPVDVFGVVSPGVFAMSSKLDGEAGQGRLVRTGHVPQHEPTRFDVPLHDAVENLRVEIAR